MNKQEALAAFRSSSVGTEKETEPNDKKKALEAFRLSGAKLAGADPELVADEEELSGKQVASSAGTEIAGTVLGEIALRKVPGAKKVGKLAKGAARYVVGGLSSIAAQKIEGKEDISLGRTLAAGVVNVPTLPKGMRAAATLRPVASASAQGAVLGGTERAIADAIDKGEINASDVAIAAGAGTVFGAGFGKLQSKFGMSSMRKLIGKSAKDIDRMIASGELTEKEIEPLLESVTGKKNISSKFVEKTRKRLEREHMAEMQSDVSNPFVKLGKTFMNYIAPAQKIGKGAREGYYEFNANVKRSEALSTRLKQAVDKAILDKPELRDDIDSFIEGGPMSEKLAKEDVSADLRLFRDVEIDTYREMHDILRSSDELNTLSKEAREVVLQRMSDAIKKGMRVYDTSSYRAFYDKSFVPPQGAKEEDLMVELVERFIAEGMEEKQALSKAKSHVKHLNSMLATNKKRSSAGRITAALPGRFEVAIENHMPGPVERRFLGEETDKLLTAGQSVRFRIRDSVKHLAEMKSDKTILKALEDSKAVSTVKEDGMTELQLKSFKPVDPSGKQYYISMDTMEAITKLYELDMNDKLAEGMGKHLMDVFGSGVALSKAVKTIFNVPTYATNLYGGLVSALANGVAPTYGNVKKYGRGAHLALTELHKVYDIGRKGLKGSKINDPDVRKQILDDVNEAYKYGIANANIAANEVAQAINDGKIGDFTRTVTEPFGKLYNVSDMASRFLIFKNNIKTLRQTLSQKGTEISEDKLKRIAAEITNDTHQNYDRTARLAKTFSRFGIMPPFVTFSVELSRNLINQHKIIYGMIRPLSKGGFAEKFGVELTKESAEAIRTEGKRRAAYLFGVLAFTGAAGNMAIGEVSKKFRGKEAEGELPVGSDIEQDWRFFQYSWARNKDVVATFDPVTKDGTYAMTSYLLPHTLVMQPLQAIFAQVEAQVKGIDEASDEAVQSLSGLLVEEFLGEGTFITQNLMRAIDNRDASGRTITDREGFDAFKDKFSNFLAESFKPGFVAEGQRFYEALKTDDPTLSFQEVLLRQFGLRYSKTNLTEMAQFRIQDFTKRYSSARGKYTSDLKYKSGQMTPQQIEASYQEAVSESAKAYERIEEAYDRLGSFKYTLEEKIEILKKGNVKSADIFRVVRGMPYQPFSRERQLSTGELFSEQLEGKSRNEIRRRINELRRGDATDKLLAKRFQAENTKRLNDVRRGKTPEDKILMNMSVKERADALISMNVHRDRTLFREYQRKGVISRDVGMLLREAGR